MAVTFTEHFDTVANGTTLTTSNTAFGSITLSSATATEDTSTSASGTGCMAIAQTANFGTGFGRNTAFTASTTAYARFCLYLAALPVGGTCYISSVVASGTSSGRIAIDTSGHVILQNVSTTIATSTTTLSTSTWYRLEWDWVGTTATVRIYANPFTSTITETISGTVTSASLTQISYGIVGSANTTQITVRYDECQSDSAANPGPVPKVASCTGGLVFGGSSLFAASSAGAVGMQPNKINGQYQSMEATALVANVNVSATAQETFNHSGSGSDSFTSTASGAASAYQALYNPVTVGKSYYISAWFYSPVATSVAPGMYFYDGSLAFQGSASATLTAVSATTWTQVSGIVTVVGATVTQAAMAFNATATATGQKFYVDDIILLQVPDAVSSSAGSEAFSGQSTLGSASASTAGSEAFSGTTSNAAGRGAPSGSEAFSGASTAATTGAPNGVVLFTGTTTPQVLDSAAGSYSFAGTAAGMILLFANGSETFSGSSTVGFVTTAAAGGETFSGAAGGKGIGWNVRGALGFGGVSTGSAVAHSAGAIAEGGTDSPRGLTAAAGAISMTGNAAQVVRVTSNGSVAFSGATGTPRAVAGSFGAILFTSADGDIALATGSRGSLGYAGTATGVARASSTGILTRTGKSTASFASAGSFTVQGQDAGASNHPLGVLSYPGTVSMVDTSAIAYAGTAP